MNSNHTKKQGGRQLASTAATKAAAPTALDAASSLYLYNQTNNLYFLNSTLIPHTNYRGAGS